MDRRRLNELHNSIRNVKSLLREVETGQYVPPKFRHAPFRGTQAHADYIVTLKREIRRLEVMRDGPTGAPIPKDKV